MVSKVRNRFIDYPLLRKITVSLVILVIVPMVILTVLLTVWLYRTNTDALFEKNHEKLEEGMSAVEKSLKLAESLPKECLINDSFLRFGRGNEIGKDHLYIREWLAELFDANPAYENICISILNGQVFEAGHYVNENAELVLKKLGEKESLWEFADYTDYGYPGLNKNQKNLLVYYSIVRDYTPSDKGTVYGTVSVRLKEEDICRLYEQMFSTQYSSIFLLDENGMVISSTDKQMLNKEWETFSGFEEAQGESERGIYLHNGMFYLYVYNAAVKGYLLEAVPFIVLYGNIIAIVLACIMVMCLCVLFGVVFGCVQRNYIVTPINELKAAFGKVEEGDFPTLPCCGRKDEIGALQEAFNHMTERLNNLINRIYRADYEKKEAELRALTEQINPHFLYNTLDSIHWKAIRNRDTEVADQVMALADVYRYLLNKGKEFILIKDELDFLDCYLFLMNMRFGGRVTWKKQIGEGVEEIWIPKLIIQPLIENALVHGLEPSPEGGRITLSIEKKGEFLNITVEDTGIGFGKDLDIMEDSVNELEGSFALKNINNRLKIHYPDNYRYRMQSSLAGGSRVSIQLRMAKEEDKHEAYDRG